MGCQQSKMQKSTSAEMSSDRSRITSSSIPPVAVSSRPPAECQGYPPPLLPDFASSCFADVDFYIDEERRQQGTADSEERQPRLACTLTWCKDDLGASSAAGDGVASAPVEEPTIDDVRRTNVNSKTSSQRRPVVIVCHGFLSWRNQMLMSHVAAGLAQKLNCHALRFDFRGNGHSGGRWRSAGFDEELSDLRTVVDYVRNELGCEVFCIAGHSKGSAAVLRFALEQQELNHEQKSFIPVPYFVNLAGRFVVPGEFDIKTRFSKEQCGELAKEGKFTMKTFGGKEVVVTQEDIDERADASSAFVSEIRTSSVLTIHGSADTTVDVENAKMYDESIPRHTLKIIEGGDHNFNGLKFVGEIVVSIAEFIQSASKNGNRHVNIPRYGGNPFSQ